MTTIRSTTTLALLALLHPASTVLAAPALEVRFYPERELRLHELNAQRGVSSALLQNAAIVNRGDAPVTVEAAAIDLVAAGDVVQSHPLGVRMLEAVAARSGRLAASGMIDAFAFQFAPAKLLAGARPVGATTLAPGEALLLGHRAFTIQGGADLLRLAVHGRTADGTAVDARAELPIATKPSPNAYLFPLAGNWFIGAGASFHSHHRWVVPEEFALDIARIGEGGRTHRGTGTKNADYHAWEAEVRAVAAGKVVAAIDRFADSEAFLRREGESPESYLARIQQQQAELMAQGLDAIGGNVIVIEHEGGEFSHYAHLRQGSLKVKVGDRVERGQPIAKLGNTGNSTEPHLHFQMTDGPVTLGSAGLPIAFEQIEILLADLPRALQTGDLVEAK